MCKCDYGGKTVTCKIDHSGDGPPEFLCRHCHPELIRKPEETARLNAEENERQRVQRELDSRTRELERTKNKLASAEKSAARGNETSAKIAASLRKKVDRLAEEIATGIIGG